MMGKGARQKITATEKMGDEDEDSEEDLDALDARGGKPSKSKAKTVNEDTYKPRVYKWKLERKR
jgi:U3 small nucleolar RNA-associated protein 11